MQTPLNASASTVGALLSGSTFEIPQFQREYSWQDDEVADFWTDLSSSIEADSYFLGLVILTEETSRKHVVDGQQRLVTLTLLACGLYYEAVERGRKALADRIQADFLRSINYETDETDPRVVLSDQSDDQTLQTILDTGKTPTDEGDEGSVSQRMIESYRYLKTMLREDLRSDPFKRLGKWTEFLTHRVYFAVFIHPDPGSAYQVFEVINTRGRGLTTADLLKNYVISQTAKPKKIARYNQWQAMARQFPPGTGIFVQYIRHAVTVESGHILPKDLFKFLADRFKHSARKPPSTERLIEILEFNLPLYAQMVDPTFPGPADPEALKVFSALNSLGVIAVRPILLAVANLPDSLGAMKYILRLVVRRIVVGNLGTGNVERLFGEAAKRAHDAKDWSTIREILRDLDPPKETFVYQTRKRSFNKSVLTFLRRSILERSITPETIGTLHFIWPRQGIGWEGMSEEDGAFWAATIGNTFLSILDRRPKPATDWEGFKEHMLPTGIADELVDSLDAIARWDASTIDTIGAELAQIAGDVWY